MTFLIILLVFSFLIVLLNIGFLIVFPNFTKSKSDKSNYLNVSIIIAFKNEEKNLGDLFSALKMLIYPMDKYEVILVDDNSSDNSYQISREERRPGCWNSQCKTPLHFNYRCRLYACPKLAAWILKKI